MSKPRSSRYLSVSTWPVPSSETPKPTYRRGEICFPTPSTLPPRARDSVTPASSRPLLLPICPASRLPPALRAPVAALSWQLSSLDRLGVGRPGGRSDHAPEAVV